MASATTAMSIDLMLPAFDEIKTAFASEGVVEVSRTVTAFLLGLAGGQLLWGPITDRFGRKPAMYAGFMVFAIGAVASTLAPSFSALIVSRVVWGIGAAGPRAVMMAIVRDVYEGDAMARIMAFVTAVFLVVPVLAPTLGEGLLMIGNWRWTFGICAVLSGALALWFTRFHETLPPERRTPLQVGPVLDAARQVFSHRVTLAYTVALVMAFGAFFPWLGSSEPIFNEIYGRGGQFALFFGVNAILMAAGITVAGRFVSRVGAGRLSVILSALIVVVALVAWIVARSSGGVPNLWVFFTFASVLTMLNAMLVPMLTTVAMIPMGHIAGTAVSLTGAVSFGLGALLGNLVDARIDGTVTPFMAGFLVYGIVGLVAVCVVWRETAEIG